MLFLKRATAQHHQIICAVKSHSRALAIPYKSRSTCTAWNVSGCASGWLSNCMRTETKICSEQNFSVQKKIRKGYSRRWVVKSLSIRPWNYRRKTTRVVVNSYIHKKRFCNLLKRSKPMSVLFMKKSCLRNFAPSTVVTYPSQSTHWMRYSQILNRHFNHVTATFHLTQWILISWQECHVARHNINFEVVVCVSFVQPETHSAVFAFIGVGGLDLCHQNWQRRRWVDLLWLGIPDKEKLLHHPQLRFCDWRACDGRGALGRLRNCPFWLFPVSISSKNVHERDVLCDVGVANLWRVVVHVLQENLDPSPSCLWGFPVVSGLNR